MEIKGKCSCGEQGRFVLSEHNLTLCQACFPKFLEKRVKASIKKEKMISSGDSVALAFSGGKDSLSLALILGKLQKVIGFSLVLFHVNLGYGEFSQENEEFCRSWASGNHFTLRIFSLEDFGLKEIKAVKKWPHCAVCGALKRTIFNRISRELGANVLAVAHTLDDQLIFLVKNVLSGNLSAPLSVLPGGRGLARKIKPLFFIPESYTRNYLASLGEIPFSKSCPFGDERQKELKELFDRMNGVMPGFKKNFTRGLLKLFGDSSKKPKSPDKTCNVCGGLSTQPICPICRWKMIEEVEHGA